MQPHEQRQKTEAEERADHRPEIDSGDHRIRVLAQADKVQGRYENEDHPERLLHNLRQTDVQHLLMSVKEAANHGNQRYEQQR